MNRPIFPIKIQSIKGDGGAVIQTLLVTAKLNGLNSTEWLKEALEKLPTWLNIIGK